MADNGVTGPRLGNAALTAVIAVSWAFIGMAGVAALGLHLLGADAAGSLGPMTAAVVAMAAGGSVRPSGDVSVFGMSAAGAQGEFDIIPLGVGLVGALLLSWVFLRSLRRAGSVTATELAARVGCTVVFFLIGLGLLAWAGHDTIAIDGGSGGGSGGGGGNSPLGDLPGLGDLGDLGGSGDGGGIGDGITGLIKNGSSVGFQVNTAASLFGGLLWVLLVVAIALLASRRTPLPLGWEAVQRSVRPVVSALTTVLIGAVAAGAVAGLVAAVTGDQPGRTVGGVLVGTPNGVWLALPLGLFVTLHGAAKGQLSQLLPAPLDQLLSDKSNEPITLSRLAELDGRVWLLPVAVALMMLTAGVLAAVRTPVPAAWGDARPHTSRLAAGTAVRLAVATAVAMPLLVWLTGISVNANLSVFGFDAVGAGIAINGSVPLAIGCGALAGALAGYLGALLAMATGTAGRQATSLAQPPPSAQPQPAPPVGQPPYPPTPGYPPTQPQPYPASPYHQSPAYQPDPSTPNPYLDQPGYPQQGGYPPQGGAPNPYRLDGAGAQGQSPPSNPYDSQSPRPGSPEPPNQWPNWGGQ